MKFAQSSIKDSPKTSRLYVHSTHPPLKGLMYSNAMLDSSASGLNLPGVSPCGPLYTTITITLLLFKQQFHTYLKIVLDRTNGHWCVLKREVQGFCAR